MTDHLQLPNTKNIKAMESPCSACPWRKSNQGKPHPHGWYTKANLRRLWAGLRTGEAPGMTCHPTDPDNMVPEGHKGPADDSEARECAGALLLITRELQALEKDPKGYTSGQRKGRLTKDGLAWWAISRGHFGGVPFVGGPPIPILKEDLEIQRP